MLLVFGAKLVLFGVGAEPANEQVHLLLAEVIAGNEPVVVPADIEHHAVATIAQQIGGAEGLLNKHVATLQALF